MSPQGILVDGNTRAAATAGSGSRTSGGVLPDDTSRQDINDVELSLQLRKDRRRDYSYINRLIAIDEELAPGALRGRRARDFNIKPRPFSATAGSTSSSAKPSSGAGRRRRAPAADRLRAAPGEAARAPPRLHQARRDRHRCRRAAHAVAAGDGAPRLPEDLSAPRRADFYTRYFASGSRSDLTTTPSTPPVAVPGIPARRCPEAPAYRTATKALTDLCSAPRLLPISEQARRRGGGRG